jgi:hypothetical protein
MWSAFVSTRQPMSAHLRNLDAIAFTCDNVNEAVHFYGASKDQLARDIRAALNEIGQLKAALELGQQNCDAVYEDLRKERDAALARCERLEGAMKQMAPGKN